MSNYKYLNSGNISLALFDYYSIIWLGYGVIYFTFTPVYSMGMAQWIGIWNANLRVTSSTLDISNLHI